MADGEQHLDGTDLQGDLGLEAGGEDMVDAEAVRPRAGRAVPAPAGGSGRGGEHRHTILSAAPAEPWLQAPAPP